MWCHFQSHSSINNILLFSPHLCNAVCKVHWTKCATVPWICWHHLKYTAVLFYRKKYSLINQTFFENYFTRACVGNYFAFDTLNTNTKNYLKPSLQAKYLCVPIVRAASWQGHTMLFCLFRCFTLRFQMVYTLLTSLN